MNVGKQLANFRKNKNKTQKEFAELLGMHLEAYQKYEYNKRKISLDKLKIIKNNFMDFDLNELIKD